MQRRPYLTLQLATAVPVTGDSNLNREEHIRVYLNTCLVCHVQVVGLKCIKQTSIIVSIRGLMVVLFCLWVGPRPLITVHCTVQ
jgi:hypothetical protein